MSIKKISSNSNLSEEAVFEVDKGVFTVRATVFACLSPVHPDIVEHGVWSIDVTDVEIQFFVNGERVRFLGFKELYSQLFGTGKFDKFLDDCQDEVTEFYLASTKYSQLEDLTECQRFNVFKELVKTAPRGNCCGYDYIDRWEAIYVANKLGYKTERENVPHTVSGNSYEHTIIKVDNLKF